MATNPTRTTYLINSEGVLEVKKFSPRTFAEVLAGVLPCQASSELTPENVV